MDRRPTAVIVAVADSKATAILAAVATLVAGEILAGAEILGIAVAAADLAAGVAGAKLFSL
jgi:hypothetical protein